MPTAGVEAARFEFATAGRIQFGIGTAREAAPGIAELGRRALLVTGRNQDRAEWLHESLADCGVCVTTFPVDGEPTVSATENGVELARRERCDVVVACGGGSAIDCGKAIAALLTNPGAPLDYLEVIGRGKPLVHPSAPMVAIPTTAGTGSEVTRNAVLKSEEHRVKVSLRSPTMLPRVAVVDPELTFGLPPDITARTGLDALTQLIEPYVSRLANPLTGALCREGIRRAAQSLRAAVADEPRAREDMSLASLFGGLALANAKLGAVHGFAGPLGGMYAAPHGAVCGRLLAPVMRANVRAMREREPSNPALARYQEVATLLTGAGATVEAGIAWVESLVDELRLPRLADLGVSEEETETLLAKAARSSSMKGNPIELLPGELQRILEEAF